VNKKFPLTDEMVLAAVEALPAYQDEKTGVWYLAQRWADGDAGWSWSWSVWDSSLKIWNGIEREDVPEELVEQVEGY